MKELARIKLPLNSFSVEIICIQGKISAMDGWVPYENRLKIENFCPDADMLTSIELRLKSSCLIRQQLNDGLKESKQPKYVEKIQVLSPKDGAMVNEHLTIYGGQ